MGAVSSGKVIVANIWGKIKTVIQSIALAETYFILLFVSVSDPEITAISGAISPIPNILIWIIAAVTAFSAIPYIMECKDYIKD